MEKISTSFGDFTKGEEIVVVMYGLCNRRYVYKGTVEGKRTCLGRDYLIMKGNDGYLYDVSMINASAIAVGEEAKKIWKNEQEHLGVEEEKKEAYSKITTKYNRI